ncbi:MAG: EthD domain-containing protein [Pseudomonadota bacterium]
MAERTGSTSYTATEGAKMMYLICRRPAVSREALSMHWFAHHMPQVIERQRLQASAGRLAASRYIATLYDRDESGRSHWDGVAQLWFPEPLPIPREAHGTKPTDSFQERAEPYLPWATREFVGLDGDLAAEPLTLNAPYPTTRSGFHKITFLVVAKEDTDYVRFFSHWRDIHIDNVIETMARTEGFRYVVSQSLEPEAAPYAGMAELYFQDQAGADAFLDRLPEDGISQWIDRLEIRTSNTEMIGIP